MCIHNYLLKSQHWTQETRTERIHLECTSWWTPEVLDNVELAMVLGQEEADLPVGLEDLSDATFLLHEVGLGAKSGPCEGE